MNELYFKYQGQKKLRDERRKNLKPIIFSILGVIILIGIVILNNYLKSNSLKSNKISTQALVLDVRQNNYLINELEIIRINNTHITYLYKVNGKEITKTTEILKQDFSKYFSKSVEVNDSIPIIYDKNNVGHSRIVEIIESTSLDNSTEIN